MILVDFDGQPMLNRVQSDAQVHTRRLCQMHITLCIPTPYPPSYPPTHQSTKGFHDELQKHQLTLVIPREVFNNASERHHPPSPQLNHTVGAKNDRRNSGGTLQQKLYHSVWHHPLKPGLGPKIRHMPAFGF